MDTIAEKLRAKLEHEFSTLAGQALELLMRRTPNYTVEAYIDVVTPRRFRKDKKEKKLTELVGWSFFPSGRMGLLEDGSLFGEGTYIRRKIFSGEVAHTEDGIFRFEASELDLSELSGAVFTMKHFLSIQPK